VYSPNIGLAYPSYKGWIDVKWLEMENATMTTLSNVDEYIVDALNNTVSQFATHSSTLATSELPISACSNHSNLCDCPQNYQHDDCAAASVKGGMNFFGAEIMLFRPAFRLPTYTLVRLSYRLVSFDRRYEPILVCLETYHLTPTEHIV
jgi:hypothetical protein